MVGLVTVTNGTDMSNGLLWPLPMSYFRNVGEDPLRMLLNAPYKLSSND